LPSFCATARNDAVVGAHFGHVGQGPKMDSRTVSRLAEQAAAGEGEQGVSEGEGGEGFYIGQSGRHADLVPPGGF
jgi:hypothetical protein